MSALHTPGARFFWSTPALCNPALAKTTSEAALGLPLTIMADLKGEAGHRRAQSVAQVFACRWRKRVDVKCLKLVGDASNIVHTLSKMRYVSAAIKDLCLASDDSYGCGMLAVLEEANILGHVTTLTLSVPVMKRSLVTISSCMEVLLQAQNVHTLTLAHSTFTTLAIFVLAAFEGEGETSDLLLPALQNLTLDWDDEENPIGDLITRHSYSALHEQEVIYARMPHCLVVLPLSWGVQDFLRRYLERRATDGVTLLSLTYRSRGDGCAPWEVQDPSAESCSEELPRYLCRGKITYERYNSHWTMDNGAWM
jgi:hypothetical protein